MASSIGKLRGVTKKFQLITIGSLYIARLQLLIVHPGFGDLQKWILQVKYSLVAKEWVSDSKFLKRHPKDTQKTHSVLVHIWLAF